ncbi:MAG TPA: diguanylate cyclase, partial [Gammaproteobacteria bacterium]|nr:diguanylate cyclase [Gammaproteobacteria bacterium]
MSFRLKTIAGIALIEALMLAILIWSSLTFIRSSNQEELDKRATTTAQLFASMAKDPVISMDLATLETFAGEMLHNPGVVFVRIRRGGTVLAEAGREGSLDRPFEPDQSVASVSDGIYDTSQRITEGGETFGRLELGLSVANIRGVVADARQRTLTIAALEVGLVALFSLLLGTYLTRQLKQLRDASQLMASGEVGTLVTVRGSDEVAETAKAFNRMSTNLKGMHDHLEQRVAERTRELEAEVRQRREAEEEREQLSRVVEQTTDIVFITNPEGTIEYVNPGFETVTGYGRDEAVGRTPRILKSDQHPPTFYAGVWAAITAGRPYHGVFVNRRRDGSLYHEEKAITPMRNDQGRITHFVSTGKDISAHIQYQEQIQHLAQHDQLTDLPNRSLFNDRLQQAIRRADRRGNRVALLFCDLNDFKSINDRFGHHAGDQLLQEVAERLRACGRREDT